MVKIIPLKEQLKYKFITFINSCEENFPTDIFDLNNMPFGSEVLVCLDENENILGVCRTSYTDTIGEESVDYVYVDSAYRRDTNGTLLVVAVMQRAVNRLIARLVANAKADDEVANAFLKKLGFYRIKEEDGKAFYHKNLLYMYKTEKKE